MAIITIEISDKNQVIKNSVGLPNRQTLNNFNIKEYYSIESAFASKPIGVVDEKRIKYVDGFGNNRGSYNYTFIDDSGATTYLCIGQWKAKGLKRVHYENGGFKHPRSIELPLLYEEGNKNGVFIEFEIIDPNGELKSVFIYSIGYLAEYLLYYSQFNSWNELEMSSKIKELKELNEKLNGEKNVLLEKLEHTIKK